MSNGWRHSPSTGAPPRHRLIGATIIEHGFLPAEVVEAEARVFHDDLEVIEVTPRSEKTTLPSLPVQAAFRA